MDSALESGQRLRIAIVGAGIGGLTLSSALGILGRGRNFELDIYEGATHISEIGAGINFWPRTWEIMKSLGLDHELARMLPHVPDNNPRLVFEIRKSDQSEGFHIKNMMMKGGAIRLHRAGLQKTLINKLSGRLHLSHRLISFDETEKEVRLNFEDGSSATCDILIGFDGIKSVVRKLFLESEGQWKSPSFEPVWSGTYAYRGVVQFEELSEYLPGHTAIKSPMKYVGKLKHLITYPLPHNNIVNVLALVTDLSQEGTQYHGPPTTYCDQEEVLSAFSGWEPEVQALLKCITKPTKWALRSLVPLDRYARGRVVIAGDAAHAMTPHNGAGAGQAVEDAYILASLLSHRRSTPSAVPDISEIYNSIRRPVGNHVLQEARNVGRLTQLVAPGFEDVVEGDADVPLEKLHDLFDEMDRRWEWVWKESAEDDRRKAVEMLDASGAPSA
ncbi:hypothetical protein HYPSUDRAFT_92215 [Hypholoma sublateritium FD-334 SS-4]|uniref:FAD-binding domain-containing protein n=1 Tax=Hypholoma sublateritium (strain FD-334 SS-4) TaxID=945553 RepID=A0A0D2NDS0_HYPSF|nr:hypothetical protein HYPSUDRAFT_92215 [Hypholoma sublateritium FD-334 SS-4]